MNVTYRHKRNSARCDAGYRRETLAQGPNFTASIITTPDGGSTWQSQLTFGNVEVNLTAEELVKLRDRLNNILDEHHTNIDRRRVAAAAAEAAPQFDVRLSVGVGYVFKATGSADEWRACAGCQSFEEAANYVRHRFVGARCNLVPRFHPLAA